MLHSACWRYLTVPYLLQNFNRTHSTTSWFIDMFEIVPPAFDEVGLPR
jgi:hypothetical protein